MQYNGPLSRVTRRSCAFLQELFYISSKPSKLRVYKRRISLKVETTANTLVFTFYNSTISNLSSPNFSQEYQPSHTRLHIAALYIVRKETRSPPLAYTMKYLQTQTLFRTYLSKQRQPIVPFYNQLLLLYLLSLKRTNIGSGAGGWVEELKVIHGPCGENPTERTGGDSPVTSECDKSRYKAAERKIDADAKEEVISLRFT